MTDDLWGLIIYVVIWLISFFIPTIMVVMLLNSNLQTVESIVLSSIFATLNCIFIKITLFSKTI